MTPAPKVPSVDVEAETCVGSTKVDGRGVIELDSQSLS